MANKTTEIGAKGAVMGAALPGVPLADSIPLGAIGSCAVGEFAIGGTSAPPPSGRGFFFWVKNMQGGLNPQMTGNING